MTLFVQSVSECCVSTVQERQLLLEEYQELSSRLRSWLTETTADMLHRDFPPSASQMKVLLSSPSSTLLSLLICLFVFF